MRHIYVNRAAFILAALLIIATALFAWWRSENLVLVLLIDEQRIEDVEPEAEPEPEEEPEPVAVDWDWEDRGETVWSGRCRSCHATLTHIPELVARDDARSYLIDFMLYGFEGEAEIERTVETFDHPPFASLSDEEIAAVLNHMLVSWGNEEDLPDGVALYASGEIDEARDRDLTPDEVAGRRPEE